MSAVSSCTASFMCLGAASMVHSGQGDDCGVGVVEGLNLFAAACIPVGFSLATMIALSLTRAPARLAGWMFATSGALWAVTGEFLARS